MSLGERAEGGVPGWTPVNPVLVEVEIISGLR